MKYFLRVCCLAWFLVWGDIGRDNLLMANEISDAIKTLQGIEPGDKGLRIARQAAKSLQEQDSKSLIKVLEAMDHATPLGKNWLTSVAVSLRSKSPGPSRDLLESFLTQSQHDGEARYLVFTWLTEGQAELRSKMLDTMLDDSSPEIRHAAIAQAFERITKDIPKEQLSADALKKLLESARHPNQVVEIINKLKEAGVEVHQANHFGFLATWKVIGPFDNVGQKAFHTVYPIEADLIAGKYSVDASYTGKNGEVKWKDATGEEVEGAVDLNPIFDKEKGAIAYARAVYSSKKAMACELRLGCINAHKVWVNGKEVISSEVYHASMAIDQYIANVDLKAGENTIVIKVCQNEQTESWAQDWKFQVRLCDSTGKTIQ